MWGSITFDVNEIIEQAIPLLNRFMPLVYVIGGVAIFGMVLLIVILVARKAAGA